MSALSAGAGAGAGASAALLLLKQQQSLGDGKRLAPCRRGLLPLQMLHLTRLLPPHMEQATCRCFCSGQQVAAAVDGQARQRRVERRESAAVRPAQTRALLFSCPTPRGRRSWPPWTPPWWRRLAQGAFRLRRRPPSQKQRACSWCGSSSRAHCVHEMATLKTVGPGAI